MGTSERRVHEEESDPETHAAMLKAYDKWDTVMMPVHAADHAYLSFEQIALPVAILFHGCTRDHSQAARPSERGKDFLLQAVGEECVLGIRAQVREGQHGDAGPLLGGRS